MGPGSGRKFGLPSVTAGLIDAGYLEEVALGLGVRSTPNGRALVDGRVIDDLVVIGDQAGCQLCPQRLRYLTCRGE